MKDDLISITAHRRKSNDEDVIKRAPSTSSTSTLCTQRRGLQNLVELNVCTDIVSTSSQEVDEASVSVPSPSPIASHPSGVGKARI